MATVDLNALRSIVIDNQRKNVALPDDPSKQVVVDRYGNILLGDEVRPGQQTTQIPQETFAKGK